MDIKRIDNYISRVRLRILKDNLEEDIVLLALLVEYRTEHPNDRPIVLASALQRRRALERKCTDGTETPELVGVRKACNLLKAWDAEVRTDAEVAAHLHQQIVSMQSNAPTKRGKRETVFGSSRNSGLLKPSTSKPF